MDFNIYILQRSFLVIFTVVFTAGAQIKKPFYKIRTVSRVDSCCFPTFCCQQWAALSKVSHFAWTRLTSGYMGVLTLIDIKCFVHFRLYMTKFHDCVIFSLCWWIMFLLEEKVVLYTFYCWIPRFSNSDGILCFIMAIAIFVNLYCFSVKARIILLIRKHFRIVILVISIWMRSIATEDSLLWQDARPRVFTDLGVYRTLCSSNVN